MKKKKEKDFLRSDISIRKKTFKAKTFTLEGLKNIVDMWYSKCPPNATNLRISIESSNGKALFFCEDGPIVFTWDDEKTINHIKCQDNNQV